MHDEAPKGKTHYFRSQVFESEDELTESEAHEHGIYVRAFMDEPGRVYKAEVVRGHRVCEVVYYDVAGDIEDDLRRTHRAAYPGTPLQIVGKPVTTKQGREQRKQRCDADGMVTEVVIETLDERGELLTDVRRDPGGRLTARIEYEYDIQGELAWVREYDGHGRLIDEQDLRG